LLAEAEKMRAEAILIRFQASEIELRLKQMKNGTVSNGATVFISDGQQL
jgi:hypothetical protein